MRTALSAILVVIAACDQPPAPVDASDPQADAGRALDDALAQFEQLADSVVDLLRPVPLMTPAEEAELRRYGNAQHVARARALGVRPADSAEVAALRDAGRLVPLEDSTRHWVLDDLRHSGAVVTPDMHTLLVRVAERFQERLVEMGLPPYRIVITSALRTAESQARLRQTNPNAAAGTSAHEFGTTVDIAYFSFAAPDSADLDVGDTDAEWLAPRMNRIGSVYLDRAAGRKSRELQAILGQVLAAFQQAGDVQVTLERQQPVYHITVARSQVD